MSFFSSRFHVALLPIIAVVILAMTSGCGKTNAPQSGRRAAGMKFPMEVVPVTVHAGERVVQAVGSVKAFEIVQVTARVSGSVERVRFKEGDRVTAGDTLLAIEPERFDLAVRIAAAAFEKAKATRREALAGLTRRIDIQSQNPGFVSPEDLESWQTKALAAEADSIQAAANLDLALLNQRYAYAPAPVSGIIQTRSVRTGEFVQTGTLVATLVRRNPLLLTFLVPDEEARPLHPGLDATFRIRDDTTVYRAIITAVAESADPVTRMVGITGEVTDAHRDRLRPGSFAEVAVHLGETEMLPAIPQMAIRPSERGFLAYVVEDSVAHERVLLLGLRSESGFVDVQSGLSAGELLVVRGAEALSDGALVRISRKEGEGGAPKPGATP
ncbi:MAG: efflux RND transporter periplasmic adaptor subunit [bacterium]|nr:efflux RND transporter periplasmic adaptor subunit [bacterium]